MMKYRKFYTDASIEVENAYRNILYEKIKYVHVKVNEYFFNIHKEKGWIKIEQIDK